MLQPLRRRQAQTKAEVRQLIRKGHDSLTTSICGATDLIYLINVTFTFLDIGFKSPGCDIGGLDSKTSLPSSYLAHRNARRLGFRVLTIPHAAPRHATSEHSGLPCRVHIDGQ